VTVREFVEILRNLGYTPSLVEGLPDGSGPRVDTAVEQILSTLSGAFQIHEDHQVISSADIATQIREAVAAATPANPPHPQSTP
jgi:hypothetical protein